MSNIVLNACPFCGGKQGLLKKAKPTRFVAGGLPVMLSTDGVPQKKKPYKDGTGG